jgi:hypothetical protein
MMKVRRRARMRQRKNMFWLILIIVVPIIATAYTVDVVKSDSTKVYVAPLSVVDTALTPETPLTIRPDGDGTNTDWTGDYQDWNEAGVHDGDSTYVSADDVWYYETSTLEDHGAQTWDIAKVKVTIWARNTSATDDMVVPILLVGGTEYWGFMEGFTGETSGGTYMKFTSEWALNPKTESYWNWTVIDTLEAGVVTYTDNTWDSGLEIRVTQLYVEVTGPLLEVGVWVDSVTDLWSFQFEVGFNPEVLNGVWFDEGMGWPVKLGPFLESAGGTVIVSGGGGYNNTLGRLFLTGAYISQIDAAKCPDGGPGLLATVFFEVVGEGESDLWFGELTGLSAPPPGGFIVKGREHVEDGYFRNVDSNLIPTASFTVTPQATPVPLEGYNTTFDATGSEPAPGRSIVTYKWYLWEVYRGALFDDAIVTDPTTTRNFTRRGTYNVTLTVIDDQGVCGIKESYVPIKAHDVFFSGIVMTNATTKPLPPALLPTVDIDKTLEINVTLLNQGDFTETDIDVTCFWSTQIAGQTQYGQIGSGHVATIAAGASKNLTFLWDTTGRNVTHPARYAVHANASAVPYEWDKERDPTKVADNEYTIAGPRIRLHDIAISDVTPSKMDVASGEVVEVDVTVVNVGDYNETSISVTAYRNDTAIGTQTIPLMTNSSFATARLPGNHTTTLAFSWNTTGTSAGTYTVKASTSPVPDDYNPYNNMYIDGVVSVDLDTTPPVIGSPSREPAGDVTPDQEVIVSVSVTDADSGVKNVTLSYTITNGTSWSDLPMAYNSTSGLYEATIPGESYGTWIRYKILAYDNADNSAVEDNAGAYFVYHVIPEFPAMIILPLFMALSMIAAIAVFMRRRGKT